MEWAFLRTNTSVVEIGPFDVGRKPPEVPDPKLQHFAATLLRMQRRHGNRPFSLDELHEAFAEGDADAPRSVTRQQISRWLERQPKMLERFSDVIGVRRLRRGVYQFAEMRMIPIYMPKETWTLRDELMAAIERLLAKQESREFNFPSVWEEMASAGTTFDRDSARTTFSFHMPMSDGPAATRGYDDLIRVGRGRYRVASDFKPPTAVDDEGL